MRKLDKIAEAFEIGTSTTLALQEEQYLEICDEIANMTHNCASSHYGEFKNTIKNPLIIENFITVVRSGRTLHFIRLSEVLEAIENCN